MTQFEIQNDLPCSLSMDGIVSHFSKEINKKFPEWREKIIANPLDLDEIEHETLSFGRKISGLLVAAVLHTEEVVNEISNESDRIRKDSPQPLRNVYRRPRKVSLLCGMVLIITTLYCVPRRLKKKKGNKRGVGQRGYEGVGLYPEWSALGISEGASPALREEVARTSVMMPSFELARQELARRGINIDVKTTQRLTEEFGKQGLSSRNEKLERWHRGEIPAGNELEGKTVAVSVDGGRARTRETRKKGRKTKKGRNRYDTPWREPKLLTIYVVGANGRIDKSSAQQVIDGTLQGPDHTMDLVAFHLHCLGAAKAKRIVFLGDGADWIWNRIPLVIERVGLKQSRCFTSLDPCHAISHIAEALNTVKSFDSSRVKKELTRLKGLLLEEKLDSVLSYLESLRGRRRTGKIVDALRYLRKRRKLMNYKKLKRLKLPIGSGCIESAIRRVINLRIKNPGTFWNVKNVERMLYLRAQILSDRWDEMIKDIKDHCRFTRNYQEEWTPTPYSIEEAENSQVHVKSLLKVVKK